MILGRWKELGSAYSNVVEHFLQGLTLEIPPSSQKGNGSISEQSGSRG